MPEQGTVACRASKSGEFLPAENFSKAECRAHEATVRYAILRRASMRLCSGG